jgi:hypothetical protein
MHEFDADARSMSFAVIDEIRQSILEQWQDAQAVGRPHGPWDEGEAGAGWVENELGFLDQLRDRPTLGCWADGEFGRLSSVEECRQLVERRGLAYQRQALSFQKRGGTGTPGIFELRATRDPVAIRIFLDGLAVAPDE